ncbi:MAG: carbohydrate ABC transporter permease [Salinispira sp.]
MNSKMQPVPKLQSHTNSHYRGRSGGLPGAAGAQRRQSGRAAGIAQKLRMLRVHIVLLPAIIVASFPILLVFINSLKTREAIFSSPLSLPAAETFSIRGFEIVVQRSNFLLYYLNSTLVTVTSIFLILLFGAMAAWALSEYRFRSNRPLGLYLTIGIMIPIRIGTVAILRLMVSLGLVNTLLSLILVYTAQGLALTVFVLHQFMSQIPRSIKDAARIDGASEYGIFALILPMVRPALATVAIFTLIPVWNDLWFPLILAPSNRTKTVILGAQEFLGQFVTDWNSVLASLSLAIIPVLIIYIIFSRQLLEGLTAGALKQ